MATQNIFFTTKETAQRLNVSLTYISYLVMAGKLTPQKVLGRNLFSDEDLTRFEQIRESKRNKTTSHE